MPRPNKIWYWKARREWFVTIKGRRHRLGRNKKDAQLRFHQLMAAPDERRAVVDPDSAAAIIDEFLEWTKRNKKTETYKWYTKHCQTFIDHIGVVPIVDLTTNHVQKWIDSRDVSDGTKNGMWRAINRAFNWAVKQELIDRNPAVNVEKPGQQHRDDFVTEEEHRAVLDHTTDQAFKDLVTIAYECGPRPQELLRVEARHVEFDKSRWHFPPREGKKERRRCVYLTRNAERITERLVKDFPDGPIFRNLRGTPWTPYSVNCRFKRLEGKVGRKLCLYLYRHAWVTRKLVAGVDSSVLKDLAGHADAQMINRVYGRVAEDHKFMLEQARKETSGSASKTKRKNAKSGSRSQNGKERRTS